MKEKDQWKRIKRMSSIYNGAEEIVLNEYMHKPGAGFHFDVESGSSFANLPETAKRMDYFLKHIGFIADNVIYYTVD